MKLSMTAASICVASLALACSGVQAQGMKTYDVAYGFSNFSDSATDPELDGRAAALLIEEGFRRIQIRANFAGKSKQRPWIRFRLNYLYLPGTATRVLSAVVSAMNPEDLETCAIDSNTWSQGGGANLIRDAVLEMPRAFLEHCPGRQK